MRESPPRKKWLLALQHLLKNKPPNICIFHIVQAVSRTPSTATASYRPSPCPVSPYSSSLCACSCWGRMISSKQAMAAPVARALHGTGAALQPADIVSDSSKVMFSYLQ